MHWHSKSRDNAHCPFFHLLSHRKTKNIKAGALRWDSNQDGSLGAFIYLRSIEGQFHYRWIKAGGILRACHSKSHLERFAWHGRKQTHWFSDIFRCGSSQRLVPRLNKRWVIKRETDNQTFSWQRQLTSRTVASKTHSQIQASSALVNWDQTNAWDQNVHWQHWNLHSPSHAGSDLSSTPVKTAAGATQQQKQALLGSRVNIEGVNQASIQTYDRGRDSSAQRVLSPYLSQWSLACRWSEHISLASPLPLLGVCT